MNGFDYILQPEAKKKHVLTCFLLTVDLVNCFFNYLVLSTSDDKKQYQAVRVTGFQICIWY